MFVIGRDTRPYLPCGMHLSLVGKYPPVLLITTNVVSLDDEYCTRE